MPATAQSSERPVTLLVLGLLLGAALGYVAAAAPDPFHLELEPGVGSVLGAALALGVAVLVIRSPRWGLVVLLLFVYLNLSEVLVRFHGWPSLLQLLILPVAVGAILAAGARGLDELALHPLTWLLGAWVVWTTLSVTWAWDPSVARAEALDSGKAFVLFLLAALLAASRERLRLAAIALLSGGGLLAGLSLSQVLRDDYTDPLGGLARVKMAQIYGDVFEPRIAGPLGDPNYYGQILLLTVPLGLVLAWRERRRGARLVALAVTAVVVAAIFLTYSRGTAVALVAVFGLCLIVRGMSRKEVLLASLTLVLALALAPEGFRERLTTLREMLPGGAVEVADPDSSFAKRRLVTLAAWEMYLDHPVVGVGAGNYGPRFAPYGTRVGSAAPLYDDPGETQYPHNLYLEVAAETGVVGLLVLGTVLFFAFGSLARARARFGRREEAFHRDLAAGFGIALAGYLMTSLFLHGHFQRYLWILLAIAAAADVTAGRGVPPDEDGGAVGDDRGDSPIRATP